MKAISLAIMHLTTVHGVSQSLARGKTVKDLTGMVVIAAVEFGFLLYFLFTGQ